MFPTSLADRGLRSNSDFKLYPSTATSTGRNQCISHLSPWTDTDWANQLQQCVQEMENGNQIQARSNALV